MSHALPALYREPGGARTVPVQLSVSDCIVFVRGAGVERSAPVGAVQIPAVNPPAPRVLRFSDGASCEVADRAAFDALLAAAGRVPPSQWEGTPRALGAVLLVIVLALVTALVATLLYGIPMAASRAAGWVPEGVAVQIGEHTLGALDQELLQPSALPGARRDAIAASFRRLRTPTGGSPTRLEFRSSPQIGPNAAALPSGTIIVTDELVRLAADDREILGVLAHEAGHVHHRHGMRLLAQQSFLALAVGVLVGDFTSLIALAPAALLQAKYSRDFEREADAYAADVLRASGIAPSALAALLERIDAHQREGRTDDGAGPMPAYLASHPATDERLAYLRSR